MVLVNTKRPEIIFQYVYQFPQSKLIFCSTRDIQGRARLYLISEQGRVYTRRQDIWSELADSCESDQIREGLAERFANQDIFCFTRHKTKIN